MSAVEFTTLGLGLAVALALFSLIWLLSLILRDAGIVDVFWGPGFAVLAWFYAFRGDAAEARALLVAALVTLWGLRLGWHIFRRGRGKDEDYRYREMRERHGAAFWWRSLFVVFWLQAAIQWVVALPLFQVGRPGAAAPWGPIDAVALVAFSVGLVFEVVGDRQLARFRADRRNRGKVLDSGLWRYTRHPNYFGDAMVWWGLGLFAVGTPGGWWTAVGPAVMTFLLVRVSGVALLERGLTSKKPAYADYIRRTSAFFPWPPSSKA